MTQAQHTPDGYKLAKAVMDGLAGFESDPADTEFQGGYQQALEDLRFIAAPMVAKAEGGAV